jgi:hypothetical protein
MTEKLTPGKRIMHNCILLEVRREEKNDNIDGKTERNVATSFFIFNSSILIFC